MTSTMRLATMGRKALVSLASKPQILGEGVIQQMIWPVICWPPGCGKTSYLRALMGRLLGKCLFYYMPTREAEMLSDPSFVKF